MRDDLSDGLKIARGHLGRAALEGLEAARVLLDASLRASGLDSIAPDSIAGEIGRGLDGLVAALREGRPLKLPATLSDPLAAALESEIRRWERRSQTDPDARPVLRAFLGLRELLWEFGLRPGEESRSSARSRDDAGPQSPGTPGEVDPAPITSPTPTKHRVQRFDVES